MKKYRGPVLEVTAIHSTPGSLGGYMIDSIRIGNRTLRKVNCDDIAAQELRADGTREVCLYVVRLPHGLIPLPLISNLLGFKYADTGEKHLIPFSFAFNSCLRFAVVAAFAWSIIWGVAGAIVASVLGVTGIITSEMVVASIAGFAFVGGLAVAWGSSLRLGVDYLRARID